MENSNVSNRQFIKKLVYRFHCFRFETAKNYKIIDIGVKKIGPGKIVIGGLYIDSITSSNHMEPIPLIA
jgi:hypothetical protein